MNNSEQNIFLNGRAQIIEMLQYMDSKSRDVLLKNIRQRNPILATELLEKSLVFENIGQLSDHELSIVTNYVQPQILGMALKNVSPSLQKRILTLIQREHAEIAYDIMIRPLNNETKHIKKAQNRILETLISLSKKRQINLEG